MRALMVQGTSSGAGKSLIATALVRALRRRGVDVVPFKAHTLSNNARVAQGGEIGAAQYFQALAAGLEPEPRMNPVLVKPESGAASQVIALGQPDAELSRMPWQSRSAAIWPLVERALRALIAEHELVVIEGAGSPAEINLAGVEVANMRTAALAGARVLLVGDIDRGGVFAHLYGTWALLPASERALLTGFVLNKFRGDPALLEPGPEKLAELTGLATLGVMPWLEHGLPDEDGVRTAPVRGGRARVALVRYPTASNLDEFKQLEQVADLRWATTPEQLRGIELVVLPGSKDVHADLAWLLGAGLAAEIAAHVQRGGRVLGICGGLQMLGEHIEGDGGGALRGLGLLPLRTRFAPAKRTEATVVRFAPLAGPWAALAERTIRGYQIRHGRTETTAPVAEALPDGLGYLEGPILGIYLHGLFEQPDLVEALLGAAPSRTLEQVFDELADAAETHLDIPAILDSRPQPARAPRPPGIQPAAAPAPPAVRPRSLVLVNTGEGKGKSTAAFGVVMRALARDWRVCVVQFIKSDRWKVGEEKIGRRLGVDWLKGGDGFTWESPDLDESEGRAKAAWALAAAAIAAGEHELVVLDEITYPMSWGWIDGAEVIEAIRSRPSRVNIVATGRDASAELLAIADTATEMVKLRHAYDRGIKARRGLDF